MDHEDKTVTAVFDSDLLRLMVKPAAHGLKTVAARVNISRYNLDTPYAATFTDSQQAQKVQVKVLRTTLYADHESYLRENWQRSMPQCATVEEARARYMDICHHENGNRIFSDDVPVVALEFEVIAHSGFDTESV
jgi:ASC-1-like (ASCH) protein